MPITTSIDDESLSVPVCSVINQFSLGTKWVGTTNYGGTNLVICKEILESKFEKTGVFDLGKPMFVMEYLAYVRVNFRKAGVIDLQSDDGQVDTEATRKNTQHFTTSKKNHRRDQRIWRQRRSIWYYCLQVGLLHLSKIVLPILSTPSDLFSKTSLLPNTYMTQCNTSLKK